MKSGLDGALRNLFLGGDIGHGLAEIVGAHNGGAMVWAQRLQCVGEDPLVERWADRIGRRPLWKVFGLKFAGVAGAAPVVDHQVARDGEQPGTHVVRRLLEHLGLPPQPQQRLLHHVLGERHVASGQPEHVTQ